MKPRVLAVILMASAGAMPLFIGRSESCAAPQKRPNASSPRPARSEQLEFPPSLPGSVNTLSFSGPELLKPPGELLEDVVIATTPPTVDFAYFPGQTYAGKPWSAWGDSVAANGKYYASVGDHLAPQGNAFVFEYDPVAKSFRRLLDLRALLDLPSGHYTPGKIHSRLDLGSDGWLYFSTHRGSTRVTTDEYHYKGDWIVRIHPATGASELVACGPVPKHCIPTSVLDPKRLIFYGGTAAGSGGEEAGVQFFAFDVKTRRLLCAAPEGPARYMIFAKSTGRVYYTPAKDGPGPLLRFDPERGGEPVPSPGEIGIRAATEETAAGIVYTVSQARRDDKPTIYSFNTRTEAAESLATATVATQAYIASIDVDPTGQYLYYVPGAHGGSHSDGSAVVQFNVRTRQKKVIAFLNEAARQRTGAELKGTYSTAVDPSGDKLYITWNTSRGGKAWDCCSLTVVHIPESERKSQ